MLNFSDAENQRDDHIDGPEHVSLDQIKQMLRDDISQLVDYLFVGEKPHGRGRDDIRFGSRGSMQIFMSGPSRGSFHSHESGEGGSALDLIAYKNGISFADAVVWARNWLGIEDGKARVKKMGQAEIDAMKEREAKEREEKIRKSKKRGFEFYEEAKEHSRNFPGMAARGKAYFEFRQVRPLNEYSGVLMGQDQNGYCMVFPSTNAAGEVTGVQRIYLDQRGTKSKVGPGGDSKLSLGYMYGSSWLAMPDQQSAFSDIVAICEGPEDAITVAQFAGFPTHAAFGIQNIAGVPLVPGQRVIVVRDNDFKKPEALMAMNRAVKSLKDRGYMVAEVYPPSGYKDVNELLQRAGGESVWKCFEPLFTGPGGGEEVPDESGMDPAQINAASGEELGEHLGDSIYGFMDKTAEWIKWHDLYADIEGGPIQPDTPKMQIVAAAGGGKTTRTARALTKSGLVNTSPDSPRVDVIVPTKQTQSEFAESLRMQMREIGIGHEVVEIQGRSPETCPRIAELGKGKGMLSAFAEKEEVFSKAACKKTVHEPNENGFPVPTEIKCPHYDSCPYIKQFEKLRPKGVIAVMTHPYLMVPAMYGARPASVVIVDEQTLQVGFATRSIEVDAFTYEPRNYTPTQYYPMGLMARDRLEVLGDKMDVSEHKRMTERAVAAIASGKPILKALRAAHFDTHDMVRMRETERESIALLHDMTPDLSTEELTGKIKAHQKNAMHDAWRLWDALAKELTVGRDEAVSVSYIPEHADREGRAVKAHVMFHHKDAYVRTQGAAVLVLDADGTPDLGRAVYGPGMITHRISAKRKAHVRQCVSTGASDSYLLGKGGDSSEDESIQLRNQEGGARARRRAYEVATEAHEVGSGGTLFGATKAVRDEIEGAYGEEFPKEFKMNHYGNIRGSNEYEKFGQAVVLGRMQPKSEAMAQLARALFCRDLEPISSLIEWREQLIQASNGEARVSKFMVMQDRRAQQVMEMYREKEVLQFIDRLRLIHERDGPPKSVTVILSLPLDGLDVDEFFDWQDGRRGFQSVNDQRTQDRNDKIRAIFERTGGVFPLTATGLQAVGADVLGIDDSKAGREIAKSFLKRIKPEASFEESEFYLGIKPNIEENQGLKEGRTTHIYILYIVSASPFRGPAFHVSWKGRGGTKSALVVPDAGRDPVAMVSEMLAGSDQTIPKEFSCVRIVSPLV